MSCLMESMSDITPLLPFTLDPTNALDICCKSSLISQYFLNDYLSFGVVFTFAIGKEIKDQIVYKGFDYKDLLVTLLPSIIIHFLR